MLGFLIYLVFFIGFWGLLTFVLWILGIWWPLLPGLEVSQSWHLPVLRFLAGYCYHNDAGVFWQTFVSIVVLIGLAVIITRIFINNQSNRITMQLMGSLALVHFLFWVILRNSTKPLEDVLFSMDNSYFLYSIFLFGILFFEIGMISLLYRLYNRWKIHYQSKSSANRQKTAIFFSCPHCRSEYHSVVKYCSYCHRNCEEI